MASISLQQPTIGLPDTTEDVKLINNFTVLQNVINGNLDATNIAATLAQSAAVNQSGQTVKGSAIIATSESRTNVAYGTLTTPDQVTGIVMPANGLIQVWYQATWQESVSGASSAAIFIGANQMKVGAAAGAPPVQQATNGGTANLATVLFSYGGGLSSFVSQGPGYTGDVTTGQAFGSSGGATGIFAAAGTYTVSIQFKASSGTVTVSNRRLYVQALSFA